MSEGARNFILSQNLNPGKLLQISDNLILSTPSYIPPQNVPWALQSVSVSGAQGRIDGNNVFGIGLGPSNALEVIQINPVAGNAVATVPISPPITGSVTDMATVSTLPIAGTTTYFVDTQGVLHSLNLSTGTQIVIGTIPITLPVLGGALTPISPHVSSNLYYSATGFTQSGLFGALGALSQVSRVDASIIGARTILAVWIFVSGGHLISLTTSNLERYFGLFQRFNGEKWLVGLFPSGAELFLQQFKLLDPVSISGLEMVYFNPVFLTVNWEQPSPNNPYRIAITSNSVTNPNIVGLVDNSPPSPYSEFDTRFGPGPYVFPDGSIGQTVISSFRWDELFGTTLDYTVTISQATAGKGQPFTVLGSHRYQGVTNPSIQIRPGQPINFIAQ